MHACARSFFLSFRMPQLPTPDARPAAHVAFSLTRALGCPPQSDSSSKSYRSHDAPPPCGVRGPSQHGSAASSHHQAGDSLSGGRQQQGAHILQPPASITCILPTKPHGPKGTRPSPSQAGDKLAAGLLEKGWSARGASLSSSLHVDRSYGRAARSSEPGSFSSSMKTTEPQSLYSLTAMMSPKLSAALQRNVPAEFSNPGPQSEPSRRGAQSEPGNGVDLRCPPPPRPAAKHTLTSQGPLASPTPAPHPYSMPEQMPGPSSSGGSFAEDAVAGGAIRLPKSAGGGSKCAVPAWNSAASLPAMQRPAGGAFQHRGSGPHRHAMLKLISASITRQGWGKGGGGGGSRSAGNSIDGRTALADLSSRSCQGVYTAAAESPSAALSGMPPSTSLYASTATSSLYGNTPTSLYANTSTSLNAGTASRVLTNRAMLPGLEPVSEAGPVLSEPLPTVRGWGALPVDGRPAGTMMPAAATASMRNHHAAPSRSPVPWRSEEVTADDNLVVCGSSHSNCSQ